MDVRDLQVFLSVAEHLNYTRAAEEVHLSQPSVSVRMRQLERDLGTKLFEQLGKKIALTEAGNLLVPSARRVIAAITGARDAIDQLQGLERGSIRIGGQHHTWHVSYSANHRALQTALPKDRNPARRQRHAAS